MKAGKLWDLFWAIAGGVSVRTKILGILVGMVLILGVGVTIQVRSSLSQMLLEELDKNGVALARDLSARGVDLALTGNTFALYELLRETLQNNPDVRYAFFLDGNGKLSVHSFGDYFPQGLVEVNTVEPNARYRLEIIDTEEGLVRDVAVPILNGKAGTVRLGMSERRVQAQVGSTTSRLLVATGAVSLLALLAGFALTEVITRPVRQLVEVTKWVAAGDLSRQARPWAPDEIGDLSRSFNLMTESLQRSRNETEQFNRQLVERNRQLAGLNQIAEAISSCRRLPEGLRMALDQVLEVASLDAGWIAAREKRSGELALICQRGFPSQMSWPGFDGEMSDLSAPLWVDCTGTPCAHYGLPLPGGGKVGWHLSVPLMAEAELLGVLTLVASDAPNHVDYLTDFFQSVGHQLGVALQNEALWDELERKEHIRGELLAKVISAQEEERKRIARELHDETGQAMTSVMLGLRLVEEGADLDTVKQKATALRGIVAGALQDIHDLTLELRPSVLDDLGLVAAVQRYVLDFAKRHRVRADFQAIGLAETQLVPEVTTALYRIVQEALTNVAKHAEARQVSVLLERHGSSLVAIVEDDGRGFDVEQTLRERTLEGDLGLHGMRERASLIGANLTIESAPGAGTTVFVEVPLEGNLLKVG